MMGDPSMHQDYNVDLEDADDYLHNPDAIDSRRGTIFTRRGAVNLGILVTICVGIVTLFTVYPILSFVLTPSIAAQTTEFNLANGTGQIAQFTARLSLIDHDTPTTAYTIPSFANPDETWDLVFSDEFNTEGRTFYPGDDPYWEAVDMHYFQTGDLEWYDPQQVTTTNGALRIWFNETENHDLNFMGGMVTTWNKFCFTGGMVLASVSLPGSPNLAGLWPAVWTMGNLGRAGYGATLEGMWPYSYDSCDVGTVANQSTPDFVLQNGVVEDPNFSFLPGQRLSRCTCADDDTHPGPKHQDGTWVGRSAPEIDVFEAAVSQQDVGRVSQSAQWAPFDPNYDWQNTTDNTIINNPQLTTLNGFRGGVFQESSSALTVTDQVSYTQSPGQGSYNVYGYEYKPGFQGSYITWISSGVKSWTLDGSALGPNAATGIAQRPISQEPMYIIANLGMSPSFSRIDPRLLLPVHMDIDWIRVYQPPGAKNIGCDPPDFPTAKYIERFNEAYTNPNLTVFADADGQFPGNSFLGQCGSA